MSSCSHIRNPSLLPFPQHNTVVHKEECTLCFESIYSPDGVDVCLTCWNGGCKGGSRHSALHHTKSKHPLVLNIRRVILPEPEESQPQKITKVAIGVEGGLKAPEEKYDEFFSVHCYACSIDVALDETMQLQSAVDQVIKASSATKKEELKAWENLRSPCEHTLTLNQVTGAIVPSLEKCNSCEVSDHLWLCLVCGNLGCSRKNFDGTGGNGHALHHSNSTGHTLVVKIGTITPDGSADVHCYKCDDEVVDPELSIHLSNFGIDMGAQQKTATTIAEMELERNLTWKFNMKTDDGIDFDPIYGPGYTGLINLGNSCYMASVLQAVMSLNEARDRYFTRAEDHFAACRGPHATCFDCQMHKLAVGLWSGNHSFPATESQSKKMVGIKPLMFKSLIAGNHREFSSMRQQDALEYFIYLMTMINRKERVNGPNSDISSLFRFQSEERLQCLQCKQVRYSDLEQMDFSVYVPPEGDEHDLNKLIQTVYDSEYVHYTCPTCRSLKKSLRSNKFSTFPKYLLISVKRFVYQNYVIRKLICDVNAPDTLNLENYRSTGVQPGDVLFPNSQGSSSATPSAPAVNPETLNELIQMGFPEVRSRKAIIATGNGDLEASMNWLIEHMDDPDIDTPLPSNPPASGGAQKSFSAELISQLMDMGFTESKAKKALSETDGNAERAVDWLFSHMDDPEEPTPSQSEQAQPSQPVEDNGPAIYNLVGFITHLGTSTSCGHYVAHIRKEGKWVVFNDEEVAVSPTAPSGKAYLYIYQRQ